MHAFDLLLSDQELVNTHGGEHPSLLSLTGLKVQFIGCDTCVPQQSWEIPGSGRACCLVISQWSQSWLMPKTGAQRGI